MIMLTVLWLHCYSCCTFSASYVYLAVCHLGGLLYGPDYAQQQHDTKVWPIIVGQPIFKTTKLIRHNAFSLAIYALYLHLLLHLILIKTGKQWLLCVNGQCLHSLPFTTGVTSHGHCHLKSK